MNKFRPEQTLNGTWGEIWIDGQYMAEVTSFKAEVTIKKTAITQCQSLVDGQKVTGLELKGEVKMHKVNSFLVKKISAMIKKGKTPTCTIISNIDDPDSVGAEKVACYGCVFDKLTLADWEAGKNLEESNSFTFQDWELLKTIK